MKLYLQVVDWELYQAEAVTHRGGRPRKDGSPARPSTPEFFAVFVSLWRKRQFAQLADHDKLALFTVWMLTATSGNGRVPADAEWIRREGHIDGPISLGALYDAGFVLFADEAGLVSETNPEVLWGQPIEFMKAAENLTTPGGREAGIERVVRDMEILSGDAPNGSTEPIILTPTKPIGNQSETNRKAIAEVSARGDKRRGDEIRVNTLADLAIGGERKRNEQWDGLAAVFGYSPTGDRERKLWGKLCADLKRAGATEASIADAARRYRLAMPEAELTPTALEKHYERLMAGAENPVKASRNGRLAPEATMAEALRLEEVEREAERGAETAGGSAGQLPSYPADAGDDRAVRGETRALPSG